MKHAILAAAIISAPFFLLGSVNDGDPARYQVNTNESNITWEGRKVTGAHNGDISISNGMITVDEGLISAATVIINMSSINTLDLDGGAKESLDQHLVSDDFFGVESFPTAQFELVSLNPLRCDANGANFSANGQVTIKGRTEKVSFPVNVDMSNGQARISGEMTLDRSKFDVQFRSKSFFNAKALGDKLIYDEFTIAFELVASK